MTLNFIGDFNDESNFPHKLLLTKTQPSKIRKKFTNGSTVNIKFSKPQLTKMVKLDGFLFGLHSKLLNSLGLLINF